ncbi:hypothetical protein NC981_15265 [Leptolyngbya sp. DQ-M1]|uniref:hypothetical protein n=1 Tax=Leptolyngbya sp. DQ-M1 TaxID=2933920 RepID=UPI003299645D
MSSRTKLQLWKWRSQAVVFAIAYDCIYSIDLTYDNTVSRLQTIKTSEFQKALETVEALPFEAQAILIDIIEKRLSQQRRANLVQEVQEAEQDYAMGRVCRGSVTDLTAEFL